MTQLWSFLLHSPLFHVLSLVVGKLQGSSGSLGKTLHSGSRDHTYHVYFKLPMTKLWSFLLHSPFFHVLSLVVGKLQGSSGSLGKTLHSGSRDHTYHVYFKLPMTQLWSFLLHSPFFHVLSLVVGKLQGYRRSLGANTLYYIT